MPEFSGRTDRELLDILSAIEADPTSYVPTAADEVRRLLEQRYLRLPLPSIAAAVEASEQRLELRRDWIDTRTDELLRHQVQPSSPPPDPEATAQAVRSALRSAGLSVFRESLLVLAIPALFVAGFIELSNPDSLWLAPFHVMLRFPVFKYIGALPWAMAKLIELIHTFIPPGYTLVTLVVLGAALVSFALLHVLARIRLLRWLLRLRSFPSAVGG